MMRLHPVRPDTGMKTPGQPPRLLRTAFFSAAAAFLVISVILLATASNPAIDDPAEPRGAVLLICTGNAGIRFKLLQAGLSKAGFASRTIMVGEDEDQAASAILVEIENVSEETGCGPDKVWLAGSSSRALAVWRMASRMPGLAGVLLICPRGLEELDAGAVSSWPAGRSVVILSSGKPSVSPEKNGQMLFEYLTGEDARLLPAYRDKGIGRPWQYTSADGLVHLAIYPGLPGFFALSSPRVLPDAVSWLDGWSSEASSPLEAARTGQAIIGWIFSAVLAVLLLAAAFLLLAIGVRVSRL
jgi:hypothetical protein